jgi:predicted RNA-binding Zn-ribbon protein involved in translation (DUF1610 family)
MIKLKIEWHKECLSCGTELIIDFFDNSIEQCNCPWCGASTGVAAKSVDDDLRNYLMNTFRIIEEDANNGIKAS